MTTETERESPLPQPTREPLTREPLEPTRCDAIIGQERGDYGFRPVRCTQTVAVRTYWTALHGWEGLVAYCSVPGHRENVRRRFVEIEPPDAIDQYKGWTEAEKAYTR